MVSIDNTTYDVKINTSKPHVADLLFELQTSDEYCGRYLGHQEVRVDIDVCGHEKITV